MDALTESDIDRVARLRRKDPAIYHAGQVAIEQAEARIDTKDVEACFGAYSTRDIDLNHHDILPERSREFLCEAPVWICSRRYCDLLVRCDNERGLIELFEACIPMFMRDRAKRAYGANHPNV